MQLAPAPDRCQSGDQPPLTTRISSEVFGARSLTNNTGKPIIHSVRIGFDVGSRLLTKHST